MMRAVRGRAGAFTAGSNNGRPFAAARFETRGVAALLTVRVKRPLFLRRHRGVRAERGAIAGAAGRRNKQTSPGRSNAIVAARRVHSSPNYISNFRRFSIPARQTARSFLPIDRRAIPFKMESAMRVGPNTGGEKQWSRIFIGSAC
jgi:hypothetical protein